MKDNREKTEKHWISFRVKPQEYSQIHQYFSATTCRKLSEYARKVLLKKPVIVRFRNQSADDFLSAMLPLKNELNAIGNNFNQAVKKLHSLRQSGEFKNWLLTYETEQQKLLQKIDEIKNNLHKIHEKWSQESPHHQP